MANPIPYKWYRSSGGVLEMLPGTNTPYGAEEVSANEVNAEIQKWQQKTDTWSKEYVQNLQNNLAKYQASPDSGLVASWQAPWGETLTNVPQSQIDEITKNYGTPGYLSPQQFKDQNAKMAALPQQPQGNLADTIAQNVLNRMNQPQGTGTTGVQGVTHTVQSGDTLSAIAAKYGVPISQITGFRSGNPNLIYPGEVLQIGVTANQGGNVGVGGQNATGGANDASSGVSGAGAGADTGTGTPALTAGLDFNSFLAQFGLGGGSQASLEDIIKTVSTSLGIGEVNNMLDKVSQEYNDEYGKIMENPWLSSQAQQEKLNIAQQKFEKRKADMIDELKLRQDAVGQAIQMYENQQDQKRQMLSLAVQVQQNQFDNQFKQAQLQLQQQQDQRDALLAQQKFEEDKRQFGLEYALAQQKAISGGGTGGGVGEVGSPANIQSLATAQGNINNISDLLKSGGMSTSVGTNILSRSPQGFWGAVGKIATVVGIPGLFKDTWKSITGQTQNFISGVEQLSSQLSLDSLIQAKAKGATFGALSDTEMRILASSATKLGTWVKRDKNGNAVGYNTTEKAFKAELNKINNFAKLDYLLKGGSPTDIGVTQTEDGHYWTQNFDGTYTQLQ